MDTTTPPKSYVSMAIQEFGGPLRPITRPIPTPGPGLALVKLMTCGLCHTDIHVRDGDWETARPSLPRIPGHEGAGVVAALGEGVTAPAIGTRVGIAWLSDACHLCAACLTGSENLCTHAASGTGFAADGCMAEYVVVRAEFLCPLPAALSFSQASPLLCAGVTTFTALKESGVRAGEWVAILGAGGGLGSLATQYARAQGFQVLAMDLAEELRSYCMEKLGAHAYTSTAGKTSAEVVASVKAATGGAGPKAVLIIAPALSAYALALDVLAPGGTAVAVSLPKGGLASLDIISLVLGKKTLRGSIVGTRADLRDCLAFSVQAGITVDTHEVPLADVNKAMEALTAGKVVGRIVLRIAPDA